MRKVVAMMALLAFMPVAHAADNMNVNAEYRVRYQHDQAWKTADKDADTNKNTVNHRFKLDAGFKASEKFSAQFTLLHNATWGNFNSSADGGTALPNGTGDGQNMALVNQAYGTWVLNDSWSLKFGRGGATIADGSVISQNDWQSTPYAFDGVMGNYEHEMFRLSLFGVKAIDNVPAANLDNGDDDPEANFFGFAVDWKNLPEFLKMANLHLLQINKTETNFGTAADPGQDQMRYGVVLAGDTSGVDYKLNYAAHSGEAKSNGAKFDLEGSMMALEVGYSMPEVMKSRFHVGYHQDSGDTSGTSVETYDSFYYEKHGASGMMDVVAWGNLTFIKAGYTLSPMDQVDVGIHYWKFERSEDADDVTFNNNGYTGYTAAGDNKDIGSEIDLVASKKYDNGFTINAWLGMFMPGKHLKDSLASAKDDTYNQFFVEGKMTF